MTSFPGFISKLYSILLHLYPASFRKEFEEQMLLDFSDLANDAIRKGKLVFWGFLALELVHFPSSLLRVHMREGYLFRILHSQPLKTGLQGAFGFGIGFAVISIASSKISFWLFSTFDPTIQRWSIWYYDTFRTEKGIFLFQDLLFLICSILSGIVFGILFALILGKRTKFYENLIVGALGWIIPVTVSSIIHNSFGWQYFLSESQMRILGYSIQILIGAFLGVVFIITATDQKKPLRYLVVGAASYPLGAYLFIKLLFYLWLEVTPWFFISLIVFMIILTGGVVAVVMQCNRKMLSVVLAGAVGHLVLSYAAFYVSYEVLHFPAPSIGVGISPEDFIVYQYYGVLNESIFGALFGLVLGTISEYQSRNNLPQIMASS